MAAQRAGRYNPGNRVELLHTGKDVAMPSEEPEWVDAPVTLLLPTELRHFLESLPELEEAGRALLAEFPPSAPIELTLGELIDLEAFISTLADNAADPAQERNLDLLLAKITRAKCSHMLTLSEQLDQSELGDLDLDPMEAFAQLLFGDEESAPAHKKPPSRPQKKGSKPKQRKRRPSDP
jgi:hypothetical protein